MMCKHNCCNMRTLCPVSLGIALGIVKGLFLMLLAWAAWLWAYGDVLVQLLSNMYVGYAPTFVGGFIGGLWGLLVGFIFGLIIGLIYDCCVCCCKCGKSSACPECQDRSK